MSIFKRKSLFALLAVSVLIGGCGGGGGGGNSGGGSGGTGTTTPQPLLPGGLNPLQVAISEKNLEPANQIVNTFVNFDGLTISGKEPMRYQWDFGDGSTAQTKAAPHRFAQSGTYQVKFTSTDADGKSASTTVPWTVSSASIRFVAGNYADGSHHVNGTAAQARFNAPADIAVAKDGVMYVVEPNSKVVRKVLADGTTTDFAGAPYASGDSNGTGANARFEYPNTISIDSNGNLYVGDNGRSIRKITPAGQVTTLAIRNNIAINFSQIVSDSRGVVYALSGHAVFKIVDGSFTIFAGNSEQVGQIDGRGDAARLNYPSSLAVDANDNLVVAESCSDIRKISPDGTVSTVRRSYPNSNPGTCPYQAAGDIAVGLDGQLYRTSRVPGSFLGNYQVDALDSQGNWIGYAGYALGQSGEANGDRNTALFTNLNGMAVAPSGDLLVTGGSHTIRRIPATGNVTTVAGKSDTPAGVNLDNVTFASNSRVAKYMNGFMVATDGNCIKTLRAGSFAGVLAGNCNTPGYVDNSNIHSRFANITGIAVDSNNNVFVSQSGYHVIRKIDVNGDVTTYAGIANTSGSQDGAIASATFNDPSYLTVDSANNLWVVDANRSKLRVIKPNGTVSTVAIPQQCSTVALDGNCRISDIVANTSGEVYFAAAASYGKAIFKVTANGAVTKFSPAEGYDDVTQNTSRLAISPQGDLWELSALVAGYPNGYNKLRRIDASGKAGTPIAFRSFLAQVVVNEAEVEFTRAIEAAAFNSDGTLMMIGNSTAFQASGLQ